MVLGETPGPIADIDARLVAALLACWQSRPAEARDHLARAEELFAVQSGHLVSFFDAVRAELAVAAGDTERAVAAALGGADQDVTPTLAERLMPLAARAMADDAQTLRDRGANPSSAVARLDDLRRRFPTIVVDTAPEQPMGKLQIRAYQGLYDAEVRRGRADPAVATAWQRAAQACAEAELAWDEAYAWWRAAEALAKGRIARDAAAALRLAHERAVDLQAIQLLSEIEALAHSARISLASVDEGPLAEAEALPGLTRREHEVLAHIVAGRTYGEIARELVLSEKTVSVHVSHLLHKTGTTNRIELAQLARRLAGTGPD